jgi:hypothetical protein
MLVKLPNTDELNFMQILINQTFNERKLLSISRAVKDVECECIKRSAVSEIV